MKDVQTISMNTALERLKQICSRSERSSYEIRKKLKEWRLEAYCEQVIKILTEENYLDDIRFARAFAHDKILLNKWGKYKVRYLLKGIQIADNMIQQALDSIDDQEYAEILFEELRKKLSTLKKYPAYQIKTKLFAFGTQRGYEPDIIHRFFEMLHL
jgi:regulatory protein